MNDDQGAATSRKLEDNELCEEEVDAAGRRTAGRGRRRLTAEDEVDGGGRGRPRKLEEGIEAVRGEAFAIGFQFRSL